jgi:hypothetical protein
MPMKGSGRTEPAEIDRFDGGVGWLAYPDEGMQRASHALATDEGVWLVDPIDAVGVEELIAEFGEVAGIAVLSSYHSRDADLFARRYDVPVHVPAFFDGLAGECDAPVERLGGTLGDSDYEVIELYDDVVWSDAALWDGETLVTMETLATSDSQTVGDERLAVSFVRRLVPPRQALGGLQPARILVGHGAGVHEEAPGALAAALESARRRSPRYFLENGGYVVGALSSATLD